MAKDFSTVSLMKEDPAIIARFIAYYLGLGAKHVHIFHDGPIDHLAELTQDGLILTECDAAFWDRLGGRPGNVEARQSAVFAEGLRACQTGWMLVVDADEFVFGDRSVAQFLDWLPGDVDSVRLATAEAVWGPGDDMELEFGSTYFRLAWRSKRLWRTTRRLIYGDATPFLRDGLTGHISGKQFLRTGRIYSKIGNHNSERDGKDISVWAASLGPAGAQMYVGHFDAISYERWKQKWMRRIEGESQFTSIAGTRERQMNAITDAIKSDPKNLRALFLQLYGMSPSRFRLLSSLNYSFRRDIFSALGWEEEAGMATAEWVEPSRR